MHYTLHYKGTLDAILTLLNKAQVSAIEPNEKNKALKKQFPI